MIDLRSLFWKTVAITPDWDRRTFQSLRGPVVAANSKYTSQTSTSTRSVRLSSGETGTVEMPVTTVTGRHEFWIKTAQGEHHVWLQGEYLSVVRGQNVTLLYCSDMFIAYIVHDTRQEFTVEANLRKLAGRPGVGMTLLQTLFIFPFILDLPFAIFYAFVLKPTLPQAVSLHLIVAINFVIAFMCVGWLFVGYPVRYALYLYRRSRLVGKITKQLASLRGYGRVAA